MQRYKELFAVLTQNVIANVAAQILISLIPVAVTWLIYLQRDVLATNPWIVVGILATGWSGSGLLGFVWFRNHSSRRADRMIRMGTMLTVTDHSLNQLISAQFENMQERELRTRMREIMQHQIREEISHMLLHLCDLLVYRVDPSKKGAAFLVLQPDNTFRLVAHVRHEDRLVPLEIQNQLTYENSMAGQALRDTRCITLRDCRKPPDNIDWVETKKPPRFIGRAAAPVQQVVGDEKVDIGAICFDIKEAVTLTSEDRRVLLFVADKIAALWHLNPPYESGRNDV